MISVVSGGTAARIAALIMFRVLRAGSGTRARYSSIFFGAPLRLAAGLRFPDFRFFTSAILQEARGPRGIDILQAALGQVLKTQVIGIRQNPVSKNAVYQELRKVATLRAQTVLRRLLGGRRGVELDLAQARE